MREGRSATESSGTQNGCAVDGNVVVPGIDVHLSQPSTPIGE